MARLPQLFRRAEHERPASRADEGFGDPFCRTAQVALQKGRKDEASGTLACVFVFEDDYGRKGGAGNGR